MNIVKVFSKRTPKYDVDKKYVDRGCFIADYVDKDWTLKVKTLSFYSYSGT